MDIKKWVGGHIKLAFLCLLGCDLGIDRDKIFEVFFN
jgi:hypothetical protein